MIPATADDEKKEAFRLYNEGQHRESLVLCNRLLETARDPAVEILAATNLFSLGKLEDAEVYFRDLARRMPESSHIHSYLAKVLERGETRVQLQSTPRRSASIPITRMPCAAMQPVSLHGRTNGGLSRS